MVVDRPGPADVLRETELPDPVPGDGELAVDVVYAGVGFVDTLVRAGVFPLPLPLVPGIEVSGRVRALGPGVTGFRVGQPVAAMLNDFGRGPRGGGYAGVAVAHASMAVALPDDADLARSVAVLVNGVTAWLALHDLARLTARDDVLVLGATGGLGGTTARLAAVHPARRVVGVVGSEARRASAPDECTDLVLAADLPTALDELTGGRGMDVVIDPVGGTARATAFAKLAPFGRMIVAGNASGDDPALSGDQAWRGTRTVSGLSLGGTAHLIPDRVGLAAAAVTGLLHRGVLREPAPAVLPLERAAEVHRALEARTAPAKTVLSVG